MGRWTTIALSLAVLVESSVVLGQSANPKDRPQAPAVKFKQGDLVRVTRLDPTGQPAAQIVYPTADAAKRSIRRTHDQNNAGRIVSLEGQIFVGHDTPATVEQIDSLSLDGEEISLAKVTISAGLLKGQEFWISARRLRNAREPDPARKALREGDGTGGTMLPIDPEYDAAVDDQVILGALESPPFVADQAPRSGDREGQGVKLAMVLLQPREPSSGKPSNTVDHASELAAFGAVDSGTSAIVKELKGGLAKVRIASGPLAGQDWFVPRPFLTRPAEFARAKASARTPGPRMKTAAKAKATRRPAQAVVEATGDLILTDLAVNTSGSGNFVTVSARFKNTSAAQLKGILVTIAFEDRAGKLVRSQTAFCQPNAIEPGETGIAEAIAESDDRIVGVKLEFKTLENSIRWVDRSGKNAHP